MGRRKRLRKIEEAKKAVLNADQVRETLLRVVQPPGADYAVLRPIIVVSNPTGEALAQAADQDTDYRIQICYNEKWQDATGVLATFDHWDHQAQEHKFTWARIVQNHDNTW